ncbi:MAG: phosphoribosyl-ATP diphosphatase [Pseudomonadota bacterium]
MTKQTNLGDVLASLFKTIESRRSAAPETSYTASLLAAGPAKCAKKFGEEAVEAAIAGALEDNDALTGEAADALYHLMVLLASAGISPDDVAAELAARQGVSGHAEKAARKNS